MAAIFCAEFNRTQIKAKAFPGQAEKMFTLPNDLFSRETGGVFDEIHIFGNEGIVFGRFYLHEVESMEMRGTIFTEQKVYPYGRGSRKNKLQGSQVNQ